MTNFSFYKLVLSFGMAKFWLETDRNEVSGKKKSEMRSFKSSENIHKKEGGSYYVVSANKA